METLDENDILSLYDPNPLLKFSFNADEYISSCFFLKGDSFEEKQMKLKTNFCNGETTFTLSGRKEHVIICVADIFKPQTCVVVMFLQKCEKVLKYSFHASYDCCRVGSCFFVSLTCVFINISCPFVMY